MDGWNCFVELGDISPLWGPSANPIPAPAGLTSTRSGGVAPFSRGSALILDSVFSAQQGTFPGNHFVPRHRFLKLLQCPTLNKLQQRTWTCETKKEKKEKTWRDTPLETLITCWVFLCHHPQPRQSFSSSCLEASFLLHTPFDLLLISLLLSRLDVSGVFFLCIPFWIVI